MYTQFSLIFFENAGTNDCVHEQAASELRISVKVQTLSTYFKNVYDKILFNNLNYYIKVMKYKLLCYEL